MAADALALLQHLGWSEEIHLVGHSLGSLIIQELLLLDPFRFASATLISSRSGREMPNWPGAARLLCSLANDDPRSKIEGILRSNFPASFLDSTNNGVSNMDKCIEMLIRRARGNRALKAGNIFRQFLAALTHHCSVERCNTIAAQQVRVLMIAGDVDAIHTKDMGDGVGYIT